MDKGQKVINEHFVVRRWDRSGFILDKYTGSDKKVVVPEGIIKLSYDAFRGNTAITSVVLPETITSIIASTFQGCTGLTHMTLPKGYPYLGRDDFNGCTSLVSLELPDGLCHMNERCLQDCSSLQSLRVPENVYKIYDYAMANCTSLKEVIFPGEKIPEMDTHVFDGSNPALLAPKVLYSAFRSEYRVMAVRGFAHMYLDGGWDLSEELVNTTLKYIKGQRKRLYAAALEDPKLLQLMVQEAFIPQADFQDLFDAASKKGDAELTAMLLNYQNKRLKPVDVEKEFEKQMTILETNVLPVGDAKKIWRYEKKAGGTLRLLGWKGKDTHVMVPSKIGKDTVTEIGPLAFSPLASPLTQAARDQRKSIESIGIPAEIETIAPDALLLCFGLKEIIVDGGNKNYCSEDKRLYLLKKQGKEKELLHIPFGIDGTLFIPRKVDLNRIGEELKRNDQVTQAIIYGKGTCPALGLCGNLKRVELGRGVTLPDRAFSYCKNLEEVVLPEGIKEIAEYAFYCCGNLREIDLPKGVETIGHYVFWNCGNLTRVGLPGTLRKIGDSAFACCTALEEIDLPEGLEELGSEAFTVCNKLRRVRLPKSLKILEYRCFEGCKALESLEIPEGIPGLGWGTFAGCASLKELTLPASVTQIGSFYDSGNKYLEDFKDCVNLEKLTILAETVIISPGTFINCPKLTVYAHPGIGIEEVAAADGVKFQAL